MNKYYELNKEDYKNLVKDLLLIGISQINSEYSVSGKSNLTEDFIEYDRSFDERVNQCYLFNLSEKRFFWQLYTDNFPQKRSIREILLDIVNRTNLLLNERHNLDEKKYTRIFSIFLSVDDEYLNVSVCLTTPTSLIFDIEGLNLSRLNQKVRKEIANG